MSADQQEAYRKVIEAIASATISFNQRTEKMLIALRKNLNIAEGFHTDCLLQVLGDQNVTDVRDAVEAGGGVEAVAAIAPAPRYTAPAVHRPPPATIAVGASKGPSLSRREAQPAPAKKQKVVRAPTTKAAPPPVVQELLPAPPVSKRLSRKPMPPPPTFTQGAAATTPPSIARSPFAGKQTPLSTPTPAASPLPYPPHEFTTRLTTSTRPQLESMLAALSSREAAIKTELAEIERLEQLPDPAPASAKPAPSSTSHGKKGRVQVSVAAGMSAKELQSTLQQLQAREDKIVDELMDMDISDDEDLGEEGRLRLRWHLLGREEAKVKAELEGIERELDAKEGGGARFGGKL